MCALTWACISCDELVDDNSGYLHVNHTEINHVEREYEAFEKRSQGVISGEAWTELFALPDPAPWEVHHASCDPRPESNDYWIGVERIRTQATLLSWTAHLMEKNWLRHTNWVDIIRSKVGDL
jgi:hypothetical protein